MDLFPIPYVQFITESLSKTVFLLLFTVIALYLASSIFIGQLDAKDF